MNNIEEYIGYTFKDKSLLNTALTHSSYANENGCESYERLEFLGDSVLSVIVAKYLYNEHPEFNEGELTRLRANLVCEPALCAFSKEMHYDEFLFLGKGEEKTGGRNRNSILADCFESVLAAIFLDSGDIEECRKYVLRFVKSNTINVSATTDYKDYKSLLQEVIQKNPEELLEYVLVDEQGPDHMKVFTVEVHLNSNVISSGEGNSKKRAEQEAAKHALELMGEI